MLLWYDPCDLYGSEPELGPAGFSNLNPADIAVSTTGGRTGGGQLAVSDAGELGIVFQQSADPAATFFTAFAFNLDTLPLVGTNPFLQLWSNGGADEVVEVRVLPNGALDVVKNGGSLGFTAGGLLQAGSWYHLEVRVVVDGAVGVVQLRLDGIQVLNLTALDTTPATGTVVDFVTLARGCDVGGDEAHYDDIALWDTLAGPSGDPFVTSIGDFRMAPLLLSADDNVPAGDWEKTGGGAYYEEVNDTVPGPNDGDTTYVQNAASFGSSTDISFEHAGVPGDVDTVLGVGMMVENRRTETDFVVQGGSVDFQVVGDIAGGRDTDVLNPIDKPFIAPPETYVVDRGVAFEDPSTATAWTGSGVNQAAFGVALSIPQ